MSDRMLKMMMASQETVKPSTVWLTFIFLGWSYGSMGRIGTQFMFYITLGGFGVWALARLLTLNSAIKRHNNEIYMKYELPEMIKR